MSEQVIHKFYNAFHSLDADTMASCYHEDIVFEDPAFGELKGIHASNMWRMLCESQKGKDFKTSFSDVQVSGNMGSAVWEAHYTFSKTGRKIHNVIRANFIFKDGKITEHRDSFDLYRWARQALGFQGLLIGWTGFFKNSLQKQTNRMLSKWESRGD